MILHPDREPNDKRAEDSSREINPSTIQDPGEHEQIGETLRDGEGRYRLLFERNPAGVAISTLGGQILECNQAWAQILGHDSADEVRGRTTKEYYFDLSEREPIRERLKQSGSFSKGQMQLRRKDGTPVWVLFNLVVFSGEESQPLVLATVIDISETKQAKKNLNESELRFRTVYERSPIGIALVETLTGRFLQVNPKFCEISGRKQEELLTSDLESISHADDMGRTREKLRQLADEDLDEYAMEKRYVRPDGAVRWVRVLSVPMWAKGEKARWHVGLVEDITDRKQVEEALRKSEEHFRLLVEQASDGIFLASAEGRYLDVNPAGAEMLGYTRDQIVRLSIGDLVATEEISRIAPEVARFADGSVIRSEWKFRRKDGTFFPGEIVGRQFADGRLQGILRDVTERKRTESRLQEYERVVEGMEEMIVVVDRDYRYVIANNAYLKLRGLAAEDVIGHHASELVGGEIWEKVVKAKVDECLLGKVVEYEMKYTYPELGETWLHMSYFPVEGPAGVDRIISLMRDITEQKRKQDQLRRSEERYRCLAEATTDVVWVAKEGGDEIESPAWCMLTGQSPDEARNNWLAVVHPDDRGETAKGWSNFLENGGFYEREFRVRRPDGEYRWLLVRGATLHQEDGRPREWVGTYKDITERKRVEEELRRNVLQLQAVSEELRVAKEKLSEEKLYLEESIDSELGYGEIIGRSSALKDVMSKAATVAPSEATVLLLGETGTGKELLARALHRMSRRANKSFIKLNCAAIPSGLVESELFGHEKGAFTGAVSRKVGRLELADGGTLFLDEIGEIPLNLQPKLLRVLQDQEFERLGGVQTLKVNFRLLAATNRDLLQSVKTREFRSDLYYRLNVFPIVIPPLRERREDIQPLVEHFVHQFAHRMKKTINSIPKKTMEVLVRWNWPGNIRELENFLERSVILTPGSVLQAPLTELETQLDEGGSSTGTLHEKERDRILQALRDCQGRLGGADGAAARLGLKRTTLQSKLVRLGIKPGRAQS
ncbi:MAG: PAS domain S-box protein [Candidatus Sulfotelmatobacter sp.]